MMELTITHQIDVLHYKRMQSDFGKLRLPQPLMRGVKFIMEEKVPDIVIDQRARNGLIQYFELASSEELLLKYQRDAPIAQVLVELVEQFEDWFKIEHI